MFNNQSRDVYLKTLCVKMVASFDVRTIAYSAKAYDIIYVDCHCFK